MIKKKVDRNEQASDWLEVWAEENGLPETLKEIGDAMLQAWQAGYEAGQHEGVQNGARDAVESMNE